MTKNIIDIYRSILSSGGMIADKEGYISVDNEMYAGIPNTPAMVGEKRLVLPTDEQLRNPSTSKIAFHPLREQAIHGESDVGVKLRTALSIRLNFTVAAMMNELITMCYNIAGHRKFNPDQLGLLEIGKDVTEETHVAFTELMKRAESQFGPTKTYVSLYVKKNAVIKGVNYHRAGIATFPMYEALKDTETKPLGLSINKRERNNLIMLMEYLLPGIDKPNAFNKGSNTGVAPQLEGLMLVFGEIASRLNDKYDLFEEQIDISSLRIDMDWADAFEDLDSLLPQIQHIPAQIGNTAAPTTTPTPSKVASNDTLANTTVTWDEIKTPPPPPQQQNQQYYPTPPQAPPPPPPLPHTASGAVPWRAMASSMGLPQTGNVYNPQMSPEQYAMMHNGVNVPRSDWNSKFPPAAPPPGYAGYPPPPYGAPQQYGGYPLPPQYGAPPPYATQPQYGAPHPYGTPRPYGY